MNQNTEGNTRIWAIAGGKGGVGKSFAVSSIGTYLALGGHSVVLIDADLGGANLHTFLCVDRPDLSLTDFFDSKYPLADIAVDSGIENLKLIAGAIRSLAPDSIKYTQKLKFMRHIRKLKVDHIIIDLGAGTHFNTMDIFLLADIKMVMVVPEIIAMENLYYFLKNAIFRRLMGSLKTQGFQDMAIDTWKNRMDKGISNLSELVDYLKNSSQIVNEIIRREVTDFKVKIILNKTRSNHDIRLGYSIRSICKKYLGFNAEYAGFIEHDDVVTRAVNSRKPYMTTYPKSRCAKEIERITNNILEDRQMRFKAV